MAGFRVEVAINDAPCFSDFISKFFEGPDKYNLPIGTHSPGGAGCPQATGSARRELNADTLADQECEQAFLGKLDDTEGNIVFWLDSSQHFLIRSQH